MDLSKIKKILIVRLSSLGDVILTTPFIRSLKKQNPDAVIDFMVKKQFEDVVLNNPYINAVYSVNNFDELNEFKRLLKDNYDAVIDLQNNFRSKKFVKNLAPKIFKYKKNNVSKFLLVNFKINRLKNIIPVPVRYANSIPGFKLDDEGLELFLPEKIKPEAPQGTGIIGFCPGSVHKTKMWTEKYFIELGKMLVKNGYKIILLGGRGDKEICKKISAEIPYAINLWNDNKLYETSVNMKMCTTVICNDSGLMHTAMASKVPVIALFGSTVKEFGFAPYKGKSLVIENSTLSCRPCSHIGLDACPEKHFDCMKTLTPELVFEQTLNFIEAL